MQMSRVVILRSSQGHEDSCRDVAVIMCPIISKGGQVSHTRSRDGRQKFPSSRRQLNKRIDRPLAARDARYHHPRVAHRDTRVAQPNLRWLHYLKRSATLRIPRRTAWPGLPAAQIDGDWQNTTDRKLRPAHRRKKKLAGWLHGRRITVFGASPTPARQ